MQSPDFYSYDLKLSEIFTVSSASRTLTESIFVEIQFEGETGYGQASFPPYMKERREDNLKFLSQVDLTGFNTPFELENILSYLDELSSHNTPSKAALDMALYDLMGKLKGLAVYELLGLKQNKEIYTSYTIGIGDDDFILRQLKNALKYKIIKVKLGGDNDYNRHAIELIRTHSNQSITIDFNQGLQNSDDAMTIIEWLSDKNVLMIEQPLPVAKENEYITLKANSPIDIYGDESIQNISDVINKQHLFHGVNIKLMKCGGINKAIKMAIIARELGLRLMIGCMTESTCAVTAAAHLASLFDRADLDGNLLITNDPFVGITFNDGRVSIPHGKGLGLNKVK